MPTRLQLSRKEILATMDRQPPVLKTRDIEQLLSRHRSEWRLAQSTRASEFIYYLSKSGRLNRLDFPFPFRKEIRYTWGDVTLQEVLMTLKPGCHFSHFTAMQMHDLTEQDSKTIYVNFEQHPKPSSPTELEQERIAAAFARKPRTTTNVAPFDKVRICLLNGKHTGYKGVESRETETPTGRRFVLRVTDLERTLIDITVRPFYAGGIGEVAKAYERAGSRISTNRLAALLRQLDYVYPYHQAIGFYLERSGTVTESAIELFRGKFDFEFDFYLTYEMKETRYDRRWRIHVPKGF